MSQTSIATSLRPRENALDALLDATKHGHLITVRDAYRSLEDLLEHDRRLRARTEAQEAHNRERTAKLARRVEQQAAWQATAGGQLTIGRIARRMHPRHCEEFDSIYDGPDSQRDPQDARRRRARSRARRLRQQAAVALFPQHAVERADRGPRGTTQ